MLAGVLRVGERSRRNTHPLSWLRALRIRMRDLLERDTVAPGSPFSACEAGQESRWKLNRYIFHIPGVVVNGSTAHELLSVTTR